MGLLIVTYGCKGNDAVKNDLLRGVSKQQFTFQFNSSAKKHLPVQMLKTRHSQKIRAGFDSNPALILGMGCTALVDIPFFFYSDRFPGPLFRNQHFQTPIRPAMVDEYQPRCVIIKSLTIY